MVPDDRTQYSAPVTDTTSVMGKAATGIVNTVYSREEFGLTRTTVRRLFAPSLGSAQPKVRYALFAERESCRLV